MKYTFDDIIINPKDSRLELGAKYYFSVSPNRVIKRAEEGLEEFCTTLTAIVEDSDVPFIGTGGTDGSCVIRKKEDEKKLVPFNFSDPDDRDFLRGKWIRNVGADEFIEGQITVFFYSHIYDEMKIEIGGRVSLNAKELLANCEFFDGSPCGKEVTE